MRKYLDYFNEITDVEIFNGLVGNGLFAEKIPNFLTSEYFLKYVNDLDLPVNDCKRKDYVRYSSMRNINVPRSMAIPEPFAYANQCNSISKHWDKIKAHFKIKTLDDEYKISRIHIRKLKDKNAIFEMNYKNFDKDGAPENEISIRSKYLAIADISNCFPSIYSHSIAWALVGKSIAKNDGDRKNNNWYNQIDKYTRNLKYGETNGVLIGPHSSNLISEIVLVSVDNELRNKGFKYIRNIDDYSCYTNNHDEAERFFLVLTEELKKFELTLNTKKSKILPLPNANVKHWVSKLNHFNFTNVYNTSGKEGIRIKELRGFLDFSIELMLNEKDTSVLNYTMKILSNKYLGKNAKQYYVNKIHHLVLLYPYLTSLLEANLFEAHALDNDSIKKIAIDIYNLGLNKQIYEACSYAIFWALKYNFTIDINAKEDSLKSMDCVYMLISYLYDKRNNKEQSYLKDYEDKAKELKNIDFDRYWLYIYEILPNTELINNYKKMKLAKISFIKSQFL